MSWGRCTELYLKQGKLCVERWSVWSARGAARRRTNQHQAMPRS